jgi:hypothetical protein
MSVFSSNARCASSHIIDSARTASVSARDACMRTLRTSVRARDDLACERLAVRPDPREAEVVRRLRGACLDVDDVRLHTDVLPRPLRKYSPDARKRGRARTASTGKRRVDAVCKTCDVSRRIDPTGTGRANAILSSERKRTGSRVKSDAFA